MRNIHDAAWYLDLFGECMAGPGPGLGDPGMVDLNTDTAEADMAGDVLMMKV
jgi:hypothetical protein